MQKGEKRRGKVAQDEVRRCQTVWTLENNITWFVFVLRAIGDSERVLWSDLADHKTILA